MANVPRTVWPGATATATATGRRAPGCWSCASQSCARAAAFPAFSGRVAWRRRPSPPLRKKLHPERPDPLGRRVGSSHGNGRRFQEPGQSAVRGNRREGQTLPRPPDRRGLAVHAARRDLREGASGRPLRIGGRRHLKANAKKHSSGPSASTATAGARSWAWKPSLRSAISPSSSCPPWQPDLPGYAGEPRCPESYTT